MLRNSAADFPKLECSRLSYKALPEGFTKKLCQNIPNVVLLLYYKAS